VAGAPGDATDDAADASRDGGWGQGRGLDDNLDRGDYLARDEVPTGVAGWRSGVPDYAEEDVPDYGRDH